MTSAVAVGLSAHKSLTAVMADLNAREFASIGTEVLGFVGGAAKVAADPVAAEAQLADAGLAFLINLIEPLQRCLDLVTGDADALKTKAADWRRLAEQLRETVPQVEELARTARARWSGRAADAFGATMGDFTETVAGAAAGCDGVTLLLQTSAELMSGAQALIVDVIRQVIEYMIAAEAAAAASAVFTMGASEAAALASILGRVSQGVEKAIEIVDRVTALLQRIGAALREISAVFGRVAELLAQLGKLAGAAQHALGPVGVKVAGRVADNLVSLEADADLAARGDETEEGRP